MKNLLYRLFEHQYLDRNEAREVLVQIAEGKYNEAQIAAFISVFLMRSISIDELSGFRDALLDLRVRVDALTPYNAVDIVGTGGDNKNTFNISTAACFVVAGAGYPVVKHGNYGSTSVNGASNVLEMHGVKFTQDVSRLERSLAGCNLAYLHAPLFNPAMKQVAPVRKMLGVRTFFNMLGPLVNPTLPRTQMLGVYSLKLARLYHYLYEQTPVEFCIVHSLDGYDEISLTGAFKMIDRTGETLYTPEALGFPRCRECDLDGGATPQEAATIFDAVLENRAAPAQTNAVVANAAFAIHTRTGDPVGDCIAAARESVVSGRAKETLTRFLEINS